MAAETWKPFFPNGKGLLDGAKLNRILTGLQAIQSLVSGTINATGAFILGGTYSETVTTVAAAGASVGTATAIPATASLVNVTVTASTEGVKLPSIATVGVGSVITVMPSTTVGVKVYAGAAGQSIGTGTTNTTALLVALNTVKNFIAITATKWRAQ